MRLSLGDHRSAFEVLKVVERPVGFITQPQASHFVTPPRSILRRLPWIAIALTFLVIAGSAFAIEPIRDAITRSGVDDARLERSFGYVVLGPISSVLDALTLFTVGQIIGFALWFLGLYAAIRFFRRLDHGVTIGREASYAVAAFVTLLAAYAAAAVLPRPMAQLIITRSDVIAIDFHSHTRFSHDGRADWSSSDLRAWHAAAGFNVAYVTDHATLDGVTEAIAMDSTVAGQGTTLLPGLEVFYHGEHVNLLNAGLRYKGLTTADYRDLDDKALGLASLITGLEPILIETIPGELSHMIPATGRGVPGVRAIEIVDGSPRGMSQTRRDHDRIVQLADSLHLALVAGSDNHGWGKTAPGWTMMRLPGWRGYPPAELASEIENVIRVAGRGATHVVERTTASVSPIAVALTLPAVAWTVSRTLSPNERLAWFFWIWVPWSLAWFIRRAAATPR